MPLDNISEGMRVPNYKALCKLLDEPVKSGNSKPAQIKEFSRYFAYKTEGNAYIITEIYDIPLKIKDGRQRYLRYLEPILLWSLLLNGYFLCGEPWSMWFGKLGMTNPDLFIPEKRKALCKAEDIPEFTVAYMSMIQRMLGNP